MSATFEDYIRRHGKTKKSSNADVMVVYRSESANC